MLDTTVRICNTYGFSTTTVVTRARLSVTLIRTLPVLCILFSQNTQKSDFMKIRPVGAELFYDDRQTKAQTDVMKIKVALRNFANAPVNISYHQMYTNTLKYVGWSFNSGTDFFVSAWVDLPASWSCLLQNSVLVLVCTYSSAPATDESTSGSHFL